MTDYNFWADLLATFRSSPDWIKALWILSGPGFLLGVLALVLRHRTAVVRITARPCLPANGRLARRDTTDRQAASHGSTTMLPSRLPAASSAPDLGHAGSRTGNP